MKNESFDIPQKLRDAITLVQQKSELLKTQRPDMENELSKVQEKLKKIPEYFQTEKELVNKITVQSEENFKNATGSPELDITGRILERTKAMLTSTEDHWIHDVKNMGLLIDLLID